MHIKI